MVSECKRMPIYCLNTQHICDIYCENNVFAELPHYFIFVAFQILNQVSKSALRLMLLSLGARRAKDSTAMCFCDNFF